jgi:YVTN family beta-propeller protein
VPPVRWNAFAAAAVVIVLVGVVSIGSEALTDDGTEVRGEATAADPAPDPAADPAPDPAPDEPATTAGAPTTEAPPTTQDRSGPPAVDLRLQKATTVAGDISPKSVVASGTGLVTAQNMMYKHTVTAYDRDGTLVATVPDAVTLSDFGIDKPGEYQGAPVEAAFTSDGSHVYVSNYAMYGPGFSEGSDECTPQSGVPASYLYRIDTTAWKIDQVVPVGATPKYVAVTPDDQKVLTTNWCTWDLTVSSTKDGTQLANLQLGRYPRGIAVSPDGKTAYVAIMGDTKVAKANLQDYSVTWIGDVGLGPRHIVISPDGRYLYSSNNKGGTVSKIDLQSGAKVAEVSTGQQPRSMDISTDGTALYVVNYGSGTMTKLAADDLRTLQELPTGANPIGITYDDATGKVWVANYSGTIDIYDEVPAT